MIFEGLGVQMTPRRLAKSVFKCAYDTGHKAVKYFSKYYSELRCFHMSESNYVLVLWLDIYLTKVVWTCHTFENNSGMKH